jgi:26S proteasome regulatory subunit N1
MTTETKQPAKDNKKKDQQKEEDLSLEDRELKEKIDGHCENLLQNNQPSLTALTEIVKSATRTMTSVPKPFKFLKTHYKLLTGQFATLPDGAHKVRKFLIQIEYANFLSVLSMIFGEKGARTSLYYLLQGDKKDFTSWGHEYVSNLASDIGK